jgi:uncharacterized membrane protein
MRILGIDRQSRIGTQSDCVVRRSPLIFKRLLTTDRLIGLAPYALVLIAFALRVLRLDFQPIWFDEDLAYQRATTTLGVSLASIAGSPLYYIVLRGWVELTGSSLYALRFLSAVCGTLTLPLIYQVTRLLLGRKMALATLALTVFMPFYVYYSQEARTYSLTLVLMLVSMYAFLRWLDTRRRRSLLVCTLANLICLYTHYVAALVIVAQGTILLLIGWREWKRISIFVAAQTVAVLALAPWLIRVQQLLPRVIVPADSTTLDAWSILARTWIEFSVGRTILPPASLYLAMVPLFLALAGLLSLFERRGSVRLDRSSRRMASDRSPDPSSPDWSRLIIVVWLIVPIIGSLLIPRASVRFSPKYLIAVTPAFYVLIVLGLNVLRKESRWLFGLVILVLMCINLYALGDYYFRPHDKLAQLPRPALETQVERRPNSLNLAGVALANGGRQSTLNGG